MRRDLADVGFDVGLDAAGRPAQGAEQESLVHGFDQTSSRWPIEV